VPTGGEARLGWGSHLGGRKGTSKLSALQDDLKRGHHHRMVYYAFDLLHLDGFDIRAAPLIERKRVLQSFLAEAEKTVPRVLYSEHFEDGMNLYSRASEMELEGIISKRADAPYRSGCVSACNFDPLSGVIGVQN
jgi:bifunctional non-homologous end joining protein LigD